MLGINDIKTGKNIILNREPFSVLYHEHSKIGRAGAVLRTRLKNILDGTVIEKNFQGADKVEEADIMKSRATFLYKEGSNYCFMDDETYDQFFLPEKVLGDSANYLVEGAPVSILKFNNQPVNIDLPVKVRLKVIEAPPGIKGDTVSSGGKVVLLETGLKLTVPLFVKAGDFVIVNTQRGEYVSRA